MARVEARLGAMRAELLGVIERERKAMISDVLASFNLFNDRVRADIDELHSISCDVAAKADQTVSGVFQRIEAKFDSALGSRRRGDDGPIDLPPLRSMN